MDNIMYKNWIVRYRHRNKDGSITQYHIASFKKKWCAEMFIRLKSITKSINEEYELINNCI